jgi:hypothetical protein
MNKLISADGTQIAYERLGEGRPVLVVGGATCDRTITRPLAEALARHFTVISYDRRGRGESGDTPPYAVEHRLLEEGPRARQVALRAEQDVHDLAGRVDGAVEIHPPPAGANVGLVRIPAAADRSSVPPPFRREERSELVDPRQHCAGRHVDVALGQEVTDVCRR